MKDYSKKGARLTDRCEQCGRFVGRYPVGFCCDTHCKSCSCEKCQSEAQA